eukprot:7207717-Prymnesium_polylepis.1
MASPPTTDRTISPAWPVPDEVRASVSVPLVGTFFTFGNVSELPPFIRTANAARPLSSTFSAATATMNHSASMRVHTASYCPTPDAPCWSRNAQSSTMSPFAL